MEKQNKKAFTLAEIVIAVAILGTIAALTIPIFFADSVTQKNQYVAGLKKTYTDFSYATDQIKANNSGTLIGAFADVDAIVTKYCRYMKCSKTCGLGAAVSGGCFNAQAAIKNLQNGAYWNNPTSAGYRSFVLADGTLVFGILTSTACTSSDGGEELAKICGYLYIDVNGFKGPNTVGKDIFCIFIRQDKLSSAGNDPGTTHFDYNTYCDPASTHTNNGISCAARVLKEGKMLY